MNISEMFSRVLGQITSGRWIITIAAAYCLIILAKTLCALMLEGKMELDTATYVAIVMAILNTIGLVTVFYFNKPRANEDTTINGIENGGNNGNGAENGSQKK